MRGKFKNVVYCLLCKYKRFTGGLRFGELDPDRVSGFQSSPESLRCVLGKDT